MGLMIAGKGADHVGDVVDGIYNACNLLLTHEQLHP
jgi:hypothetical protein